MILPLIIIGMASAGSTIRVLRGNLLDELKKQYVVTARAKGVSETQLLFKYPVRLALNPGLQHDRLAAARHLCRRSADLDRAERAVDRPAVACGLRWRKTCT